MCLSRSWTNGGVAAPTRREQGLVRWQDNQATPDTWEDLEDLRRCFPTAPTWGQVVSEEGGGVRDPAAPGLAQATVPSRPRGERRPCHKFIGPQWISYIFSLEDPETEGYKVGSR